MVITKVVAVISMLVTEQLIVMWIYSFIKKNESETERLICTDEEWDDDNYKHDCKKLEVINRHKRKKLAYLPVTIGLIEVLLVWLIVVTYRTKPFGDLLHELFIIMGGWIAIKIFGGYQPWGQPAMGRAHFYNFLIASFANIALSTIIAYLVIHFMW